MRKALLLLTFLTLTIRINAQEIEWQNTIGGSGDDYLQSIEQTSDGGYILGGYSKSPLSGDKTEFTIGISDWWIIKTDNQGNIQWQNTIGGIGGEELCSIQQTSDGGYIMGGTSPLAFTFKDYWIVKTDSLGIIEWQNTIGGGDNDFLKSIQQTTDGGYILGGWSQSNISGDKTEDSNGWEDYWIVKTDSLGAIQWQNTIGGNNQDLLYSIRQTTDGGYIMGGWSGSDISGDKTENNLGNGNWDYWIVKTDGQGIIQWQNTIGGTGSDQLTSIQQTTDGGYFMGGYSNSDISSDKTENSMNQEDYWIVKTDSLGTIQWDNTIGGGGEDRLLSIQQTTEGGYILGGYSSSGIYVESDKTENSMGWGDYWIVKIDSLGNIKWQNTIGGSSSDQLYSIKQTTDGGYIMGGWSKSNISGDKTENSQGSYDYWIVKVTGNYNLIQGKTYADLNSNQTQEQGDPAIPYLKITESNTNRFAFSQPTGFYSIAILDSGNFEVSSDYVNLFNPVPLTHTGNFTAIQQIDSLNDFAFQPTGTFNDLCLTITPTCPFRSGFNASYNLNYSNQGTTTLTPTIVFYPYSNVSFVSASITPTTVTPDSVIFVLGTLTPFQSGLITITVSVDLGLPIGTLVNSGAMILPIANDANPGCNSSY